MAGRTPSSSKRRRRRQHDECAPAVVADDQAVQSVEVAAERKPEKRRIHVIVVATLVVLCAALYAWTVDFPMVFDDGFYMKDNPLFKDPASFSYPAHLAEFANRAAKMGLDPDLSTNFILRPVAYASLHLNYALDGFNPRWFRAVNIVIHVASSILIYALMRLLFRHSPGSGSLPRGSTVFIPATAALLFAAHPLATESVTYIIQRFTSMSTLFYLLTLWLYFASLHAASRAGRRVLRASAVVVTVLGMLTKECVFTAPFVALMIDCLVNGTRLKKAALSALPLLLCLPIIPALVLLTSAAQHEGQFGLANAFNIANSREHPLSHWHYFVTQITVVAGYLQKIFWPAGLNLDPEWTLHRSFRETPVLLALAQLVALTAGAWWMWRRRRTDARASLAFAFALWFFVTVSVSSGLVPLPDLTADHRSYLPSIGVFVLVACVLDGLRTWNVCPRISRTLAPALSVLCIGALGWATCARNEVWRTSISLWEDSVAKSPGKYRVWGNLGCAYSQVGNEDEAVKCFRKSLEIQPRFQYAAFNLSNSLLRLNRPGESLEASLRLIELDRQAATKPPVVFTVGLGLVGVGRYDEAIAVFNDILAVMPDDVRTHKALGMVYLRTNKPRSALEHYQRAARNQPPDQELLGAIRAAEAALVNSASRPMTSLPFRLQ